MAEGSKQAAILIATSFQALNRAFEGRQETLISDCTVLILFAGFFIEATLNHIIDHIGQSRQMRAFLHKRYPGMQDKLAWFYNEFVGRIRAPTKKELFDQGIESKLGRRFPGFPELYRFRNDISHGEINVSATSLARARRLRQQAKDLVGELYLIAEGAGHKVPRLVTYKAAVASLAKGSVANPSRKRRRN